MAERTDLTTQQLIEAIAQAVMGYFEGSWTAGDEERCMQLVAETLEANGCWFCRLSEHADWTHFEPLLPFGE